MSGGSLVVVDRAGRDVKRYELPHGMAHVGRAATCHVRVMQAAVSPLHATLLVRQAQTVIRNDSSGITLVNGAPVSVCALQHNDVITVGDRTLRWEYYRDTQRPVQAQRALHPTAMASVSTARRSRGRRSSPAAAPRRSPTLDAAIEMRHRASMPASAGGKQVAIVQPQRRDHGLHNVSEHAVLSPRSKRARLSKSDSELTTKASLWIESRKTPNRNPAVNTPKAALPLKQATPKPNTPAQKNTPKPRKSTPKQRNISPRQSSIQGMFVIPEENTSTPKKSPRGTTQKQSAIPKQSISKTPRISTSMNTSRKITPRKITSNITPRPSTSKLIPQQSTLRQMTPKPSTSRIITSRQSTSIITPSTSKLITPRQNTSRQITPSTSKLITPRQSTSRIITPSTSKLITPRQSTSRQVTLRQSAINSRISMPRTSSARKATPLRLTVLRKAQSAVKAKVMKIEDPTRIDHTKQAAIMLMTGHAKPSSPRLVLKRPSPVQKGKKGSPGKQSQSPRRSGSAVSPRHSDRQGAGDSVSVLEITDSEYSRPSTSRLTTSTTVTSPSLPSPKKSALKDPRKSTRKTESITFDLSNLENFHENTTTGYTSFDSYATGDNTLRYSESTYKSPTPSPRRPIHSRSSQMLVQAGSPLPQRSTKSRSPNVSPSIIQKTLTPSSPRSRASLIVQNALSPQKERSSRSKSSITQSINQSWDTTLEAAFKSRTLSLKDSITQSIDQTWDTTVASAFKSRTLSPKALERYSVVDLVSDNDNTQKTASLYDSLGTTRSSSIVFGTPQTGRKTRSLTLKTNALTSSTPYVDKTRSPRARQSRSNEKSPQGQLPRSSSTPNISTRNSKTVSRRSQSLTTPENTVSINSTRISRVSKSRSRINDSDLQFLDETTEESPKSSRKSKQSKPNTPANNSPNTTANSKRGSRRKLTVDVSLASSQGTITPENHHSPEELGTPVLSIQSLLSSSQSSFSSQQSQIRSPIRKRTTIGVIQHNRKSKNSPKSKSFTASARKSLRGLRLNDTEKESTPTSAVKLVPEAVKNKHSTAKKPQSKRSIIDDLNESDFVKQLFNSPVKRNLSRSMTEMSRKQFDEGVPKRTRNTIHLTGQSPTSDSILDRSQQFTPEGFVSPLSTPGNSPNLSGVKRLFSRNTPTPTRNSVRKNLSDILDDEGVASPRNRSAKKVTASPNNDLRRVTGVKALFQEKKSPKNDLSNVSGVKDLFKRKSAANDLTRVSGVKRTLAKSPKNDLTRVSGVKKTLVQKSPKNDLRDVRGVKRMFSKDNENNYSDLSGVEELFNESNTSRDPERLFDQLVGKPPIKAVYSKSFLQRGKPKKLQRRSLRQSIDTNNVEEWLNEELNKCLHKDKGTPAQNKVSKELQKLATDTVEGTEVRTSRVRNSTIINSLAQEGVTKSASLAYSARKLPIKKRSFVEASLELCRDTSNSLPIKKRAVAPQTLHSTPVRGRYNVTMNATEIRTMSPIAAVDVTRMDSELNRSPQRASPSKPKSPKASPKKATPKIATPKKATPKLTGKRVTKQNSDKIPEVPQSPKGRRAQTKASAAKVASPVLKVVTPVISPKGKRTRGKIVATVEPPKSKPKRQTKETTQVSKPSPKQSRRGKQNVKNKTVEVTESIPKGRKKATETVEVTEPIPKRRKKVTEKVLTPQLSPRVPKPKRGRKEPEVTASPKPSPKKTRGRQVQPKISPAKPKSSRGATKHRVSLVIPKKPPVLSPKATKNTKKALEKLVTPENSRRRKTSLTPRVAIAKMVLPKASPVMKPKGSRRGKKPPTPKASPKKASPKPKGKKAKASPKKSPEKAQKPAVSPIKRGRRNANITVVLPIANTQKKESPKRSKSAQKASPKKPASKRGAKEVPSTEPSPKKGRQAAKTSKMQVSVESTATAQRGRKRKAVDDQSPVPAKLTKSSPKPTRGRKKPETPAKTPTPTKTRGKAKATKSPAKPSPVKPAKKNVNFAKSPLKATKAKSPVKGAKKSAKAAISPVKATTGAKSPVKGAKKSAKAAITPEKPARSVRGAAKASPAKKAVKSLIKATKTVKPAKTAVKAVKNAIKAAKSPVKAAKLAKSVVKAVKNATKAVKSPARTGRRATSKAVKSPEKKVTLNTTRSRKISPYVPRSL